MHCAQKLIHRLLSVIRLPSRVAEQLNRLNVGVAVDHPPGHHRSRVGLIHGRLFQPRQVITKHQGIARQPPQHGNHQDRIALPDQEHHREKIHRDIDHDVQQLHHGFSYRQRGLHHLGGDSACEFVLVKAHGLAQQIAVCPPADGHGIVAQQRLVHHRTAQPNQTGQQDQHKGAKQQQFSPTLGDQGVWVLFDQPIH